MQNIKVDKVDKNALTVEKVHDIIVIEVDKVHSVDTINTKVKTFGQYFFIFANK